MSVDYDAFIADLEAKRTAFNAWVDGAIQNIRQIQTAMSGVPQTAQPASQVVHPS